MSRRAARAFALLALLVVVSPLASATGFTFGADRHMEADAKDGAAVAFDMPVSIQSDGRAYAKLLVTDGNAVNDGTRANGTLSPRAGWWVGLEWTRADGSRTDLGAVVDGTPTSLVPVRAGELDHLLATVHAPEGAAAHGAAQKVYLALAFRVGVSPDEAGSSGGQMDEARALTLTLKFDGSAPPPANATPNGTVTPPTLQDGAGATAPGAGASSNGAGGGASGDSSAGSGSGARGSGGAGSSNDDGLAAPPVSGIPLGANGNGASSSSTGGGAQIPTWFLVWAGLLLTALTVAILGLVVAFALAFRRGDRAAIHLHVANGETILLHDGDRVRSVPLREEERVAAARVVQVEEDG